MVRSRSTGWLAALLLIAPFLAPSRSGAAESPSEPPPPGKTKEAQVPREEGEPEAAEAGGPGDIENLRQGVATHLSDLEGAAATASGGGLRVDAFIVPDALAYRIAREYLKRREGGANHEVAVRGTATAVLKDARRLEGLSSVIIKIAALEIPRTPPLPGVEAGRRIYTFEGNFTKDGLALSTDEGKPTRFRLAGRPANLRSAQLRVQKFWKLSDRRPTKRYPGAPSAGWEPVIGKPIPALVIEEKPVEAELVFKVRAAKDLPGSLEVSGFKRYDGPFQGDILDLNSGRTWNPIPGISASLRSPPAGLEIPPAVARLVKEVREAGKKP